MATQCSLAAASGYVLTISGSPYGFMSAICCSVMMPSSASRVTRDTSAYARARAPGARRSVRLRMQSVPQIEPPMSTFPRSMTVPLLKWYILSAEISSIGTKTIGSSASEMRTVTATSTPRKKGTVVNHGPLAIIESSPCSFCDKRCMRCLSELPICTCLARYRYSRSFTRVRWASLFVLEYWLT